MTDMYVVYSLGLISSKPEKAFEDYDDAYAYAKILRRHVLFGVDIKKVGGERLTTLMKGHTL